GSFAFGQVGWTDGLSGIEWIFQRDNFGPDVTTAALGLLESVVGHKSGHHVGMRRNQDTEGFARDLRSGVYEGDCFHSVLGFEIFECRAKNSERATAERPRGVLRPLSQFWRVSRVT